MANGLPTSRSLPEIQIDGIPQLGSCILNNILTEMTVPPAYDDFKVTLNKMYSFRRDGC